MMISVAASGVLLSSFSVGRGTDIFHLLLADDTLIFFQADPNILCNLRCLFLYFEDELSQVGIGSFGKC
jgi:hypothetical protein